jgi:hypothetical protein
MREGRVGRSERGEQVGCGVGDVGMRGVGRGDVRRRAGGRGTGGRGNAGPEGEGRGQPRWGWVVYAK